ncbi:hypothetical protein IWX83_003490 [Flavobacterium sp. CG_9.1]|uniref:hypothetical protein n=1 Tax=Flavobacterium sp. CG_9.1 TaxID=2787728 RepID=UPI0018CAC137|nr:hypothetical protein [Flavobacterium sp. CG_9.1]MBG6063674.1 hypothetical protein [Flavobacterium sp. CG_9.1]
MNISLIRYFVLSICYIFIIELANFILKTDLLIYNSLAAKLGKEQISEILNFQKKWEWVSFLSTPVFFLIKITLISSVLYIGTAFSDTKIYFKAIFDNVIKAEFIFLLVPIFKIIWFYFFQTSYSLEDIQYFYPLSALNIVGYKGLEPWLIYPFQTLNLFELSYWLILAFFIGKATETTMDHGLKIVASSYGSALLLWVVVIMFFTLNYS